MAKNNFDLKTRDLAKAGKFALRQFCTMRGISFSTVVNDTSRWRRFARFARAKGIKWMEDISEELVLDYCDEVADRVLDDDLSAAHGQNLISAINTVMKLATHGRWHPISPTGCGIPKRNHVRLIIPTGLDRATVSSAVHAMHDGGLVRAACVTELAREFGLRLKEAAMLDSRYALDQAVTNQVIDVVKGTKGGRARTIPVRLPSQIETLKRAAKAQGTHSSLIPCEQTWAKFRDGEIRAARSLLKNAGISKFQELRAAYVLICSES